MKSGTKDQAEGKFHKVKGKLSEIAGKLSMKSKLEAEGKDEKIAGKVQEKIGQVEKSLGSSRAAYHTPDSPGCEVEAAQGTDTINPYDVRNHLYTCTVGKIDERWI